MGSGVNIKLISQIKEKLEDIGFDQQPGSILYSGNETVKKGKFYFLGANPGGHSDQNLGEYPDTVANQLLRKNTSSDFNEYFDARWQIRGRRPTSPGKALLQRRIKYLFDEINVNLREVLSTNLVFVRSPTLEEFHLSWDDAANRCWTIHEMLLTEVSPEIIIVYGSEAYEFIRDKINIENEDFFEVVSLNESKYFSKTSGILNLFNSEKRIKLISTPHLSRYKIDAKGPEYGNAYDVRPAIQWIKEEFTKA